MTSVPKPRPGTLAWRARQTEQVLDKFRDQPFCWQRANGWKLTRAMAVALGHSLPPVPMFRTELGCRQALAKTGAATVADYLDRYFPRWPAPAFALIGDLVVLEDHVGGETVCVADGLGNLFGWHGHEGAPEGFGGARFAGHPVGAWKL